MTRSKSSRVQYTFLVESCASSLALLATVPMVSIIGRKLPQIEIIGFFISICHRKDEGALHTNH